MGSACKTSLVHSAQLWLSNLTFPVSASIVKTTPTPLEVIMSDKTQSLLGSSLCHYHSGWSFLWKLMGDLQAAPLYFFRVHLASKRTIYRRGPTFQSPLRTVRNRSPNPERFGLALALFSRTSFKGWLCIPWEGYSQSLLVLSRQCRTDFNLQFETRDAKIHLKL